MGGDEESGNDKEEQAEAERERLEALQEAEDKRKDKHRKMEEEREKMRQGIRDKVRIYLHTIRQIFPYFHSQCSKTCRASSQSLKFTTSQSRPNVFISPTLAMAIVSLPLTF